MVTGTVLVTGGAGFIGSHICENLLTKHYKVICLDNFDPYYAPGLKRNNIMRCLNKNCFKLIEMDVRDKKRLNSLFRDESIEKIIHLAARPGVRSSLENPVIYEEINVRGTLNLLELSRKYEIDNFVFISSSSVYGNNNRIPFREDDPVSPTSPYAASKRGAEIFCETYANLYGVPIISLRLFSIYGPRQRPDMAVHKFTRSIYEGREIQLYGDGSSKRDYTHVYDAVNIILRILNRNFSFEIFNVGSSRPIELLYVVSLIEKELGKKAKIKYLPSQLGDVPITYADITKAHRMLGYRPNVIFEDGIKRFIRSFLKKNR